MTLLLPLLLFGCQLWAPPGPPVRVFAPPLGEHRYFQRDLEIRHGDAIHHFIGIFDLAPQTTRITLLSTASQPVLTLQQTPRQINLQRTPRLPSTISADDLIADIQLALWPVKKLRAGLPPGWTLTADKAGRTLGFHGTTEVRVDYQNETPSSQPLPVYNARHDYLLIIGAANS